MDQSEPRALIELIRSLENQVIQWRAVAQATGNQEVYTRRAFIKYVQRTTLSIADPKPYTEAMEHVEQLIERERSA